MIRRKTRVHDINEFYFDSVLFRKKTRVHTLNKSQFDSVLFRKKTRPLPWGINLTPKMSVKHGTNNLPLYFNSVYISSLNQWIN